MGEVGQADARLGRRRHLERQNAEQMGTAKIAIELARDLGAPQAASLERLANSALMLDPGYHKVHADYVAKIGGRKSEG
ncbi:MAG: hypothetical protein KGK11_13770 [Sphingomonadales bacterium]|nr:hypothetical protein [Sphingomonadales bacterium]